MSSTDRRRRESARKECASARCEEGGAVIDYSVLQYSIYVLLKVISLYCTQFTLVP
jgi:hypothetical protein